LVTVHLDILSLKQFYWLLLLWNCKWFMGSCCFPYLFFLWHLEVYCGGSCRMLFINDRPDLDWVPIDFFNYCTICNKVKKVYSWSTHNICVVRNYYVQGCEVLCGYLVKSGLYVEQIWSR